jgi:hypothetical protein
MRRMLLTMLTAVALALTGLAVAAPPRARAALPLPVTTAVSIASDGQLANANAIGPRLSGDGRHTAFVTTASNLVDNPGQGSWQVIVHELAPPGATAWRR